MKRPVAIGVAGIVASLTIMGGTLVAAQSGIFSGVTITARSHQTASVNSPSQASGVVVEYYTQTGSVDMDEWLETTITDTTASDAPFRTKLYEAYTKLRDAQNSHAGISAHLTISGALTDTHHVELDDDNFTGLTDTLTSTHHHELDDDNFTGLTDTITGTHHHELDDDNFTSLTNTITVTEHTGEGEKMRDRKAVSDTPTHNQRTESTFGIDDQANHSSGSENRDSHHDIKSIEASATVQPTTQNAVHDKVNNDIQNNQNQPPDSHGQQNPQDDSHDSEKTDSTDPAQEVNRGDHRKP